MFSLIFATKTKNSLNFDILNCKVAWENYVNYIYFYKNNRHKCSSLNFMLSLTRKTLNIEREHPLHTAPVSYCVIQLCFNSIYFNTCDYF